ncbi:MAG: hypothetical protein AAGG68_08135 [Bacteroidota bacterium]
MIKKRQNIVDFIQKVGTVLLITALLLACSRENFDVVETVKEEIVPEITYINSLTDQMSIAPEGNAVHLGCFSIQAPFSVVDKNEEQHTVNTKEDFNTLFGNANYEILDFVYPITIKYKDGETKDINGGADLGTAFASCVPTGGWTYDAFPAYAINTENSCYELEFPIQLKQLDNTTKTVEDQQTFNALLAEENALLFFDFPLNLKSETNEIFTAEDVSELLDLLVGCNGFDGDGLTIDDEGLEIWCYDIQYPLKVLLWDGSKVEVNGHEALCDLMLEGEMVSFIYPFNLLDEDGNELRVDSEYHFEVELWECEQYDYRGDEAYLLYMGTTPFGREACYKIKFPVEVIAYPFDGGTEERVRINDITRLTGHVLYGNYQKSEIVYPITLKYLPRGLEVNVNDLTQLMDSLEDCF